MEKLQFNDSELSGIKAELIKQALQSNVNSPQQLFLDSCVLELSKKVAMMIINILIEENGKGGGVFNIPRLIRIGRRIWDVMPIAIGEYKICKRKII